MNAKNRPISDPLERQLRKDAQSMAPEFSEFLHEQTLRAIRRHKLRAHAVPAARSFWPGALTAAAAALVIGFTLWQLRTHPAISLPAPSQPVAIAIPNAGDLLRHGAEPLRQAIASIDAPRFSDIQRDAQNLARYFAQQLPTSDPRGNPKTDQRL